MSRARDIYGSQHGPKYIVPDREDVIMAARALYPNCYIEASTGMMLTIWNDKENIGSAWEQTKGGKWCYRLIS
jgi:hypothetical protein